MRFPSDEELFGLIPQKNGKYLAGNIDPAKFNIEGETLLDAYNQGLRSAFEKMPTKYHEKKVTFPSWAEYTFRTRLIWISLNSSHSRFDRLMHK